MSYLFQDDGPEAGFDQKVCLATTAYDNPDASYTFSIQRSREALREAGIKTAYFLLSGNCHVDDARNVIVQEFLLSDCTELMFLDADVSWRPEEIVKLCKHDVDVVGGVYPFRSMSAAEKRGMPVRMIHGVNQPDDRGLLEVEGLPTGFMKIKRHVLESLAKDADSYWNRDDRRSRVPILFERAYVAESDTRWGGDLNFCRKWRAKGGSVWADYEMVLGHTAKAIVKDSLGAGLRRQAGTTLRHICNEVRRGRETMALLDEARRYIGNPYSALEDVLTISIIKARQADGPIIETGSGLTTILMAAANPNQTVYCLEHSERYAQELRNMAKEAGVGNIGLCICPINDGWYDLSDHDDLPDHFALGLNDGPPRSIGSRMGFYERFGGRVDTIIADDADDHGYAESLRTWGAGNGFDCQFIEPRAMLMTGQKEAVKL